MKKKLLVLLLIIIVAAFAFVGCAPGVKPDPEPEPGPSIDGVKVEFGKEYRDGDKIYVASGSNTITVTFPAPVPAADMVKVDLSDCTGDHSKAPTYLFPVSADRTVWEGTVKFNCMTVVSIPCEEDECKPQDCCATTVVITSGACEDDTCIAFPVIVDCEDPYAKLEVTAKDCCCSECAISFKSVSDPKEDECAVCPPAAKSCCGDDCSGLASWKIEVRKVKGVKGDEAEFQSAAKQAFADNCCEFSTCTKLVTICEGDDCPIECVTDCIEDDEYDYPYYYFAIVTLVDNVGNSQRYYAGMILTLGNDGKCVVGVYEGCCDGGKLTWDSAYDLTSKKFFIGGCKGDIPCPAIS